MAQIWPRKSTCVKNDSDVLGKSYKTIPDENKPPKETTVGNRPAFGLSKGTIAKRTVLGTLPTNVDFRRDSLLAKPKVPFSKPSFTVFEDTSNEPVVTSAEPAKVLTVPKPSIPVVHNASPDSPMRIDNTDEAVAVSASPRADLRTYYQEIYQYMKDLQKKLRPKSHYMRKQPDITHSMRSVLVDWLVEVAEEYNLNSETLYLCVSYIDHFLSTMSVLRSKLQLVGTASMFIASKYEEIYPPDVGEFVYITDGTYTKKQVLRMEQLILKVLSFDLAIPTVNYFLQCFFSWIITAPEVKHLAEYLCELTLMHAEPFLQYLPSEIACSALALAFDTLDFDPWYPQLTQRTGYDLNDFRECFGRLHATFAKAATFPQQAIREKYSSSRYMKVALLKPYPLKSS